MIGGGMIVDEVAGVTREAGATREVAGATNTVPLAVVVGRMAMNSNDEGPCTFGCMPTGTTSRGVGCTIGMVAIVVVGSGDRRTLGSGMKYGAADA